MQVGYLSHLRKAISVLLCFSLSKGNLHHTILAIEEATVLPVCAHLLQPVVPHVGHFVHKDAGIPVTAVSHLNKESDLMFPTPIASHMMWSSITLYPGLESIEATN